MLQVRPCLYEGKTVFVSDLQKGNSRCYQAVPIAVWYNYWQVLILCGFYISSFTSYTVDYCLWSTWESFECFLPFNRKCLAVISDFWKFPYFLETFSGFYFTTNYFYFFWRDLFPLLWNWNILLFLIRHDLHVNFIRSVSWPVTLTKFSLVALGSQMKMYWNNILVPSGQLIPSSFLAQMEGEQWCQC